MITEEIVWMILFIICVVGIVYNVIRLIKANRKIMEITNEINDLYEELLKEKAK